MPSLINLRILDVSNNKLESLDGLSSLPKLEELYAHRNELRDILPVMSCGQLRVLNAANNHITSLDTTLKVLSNLRFLQVLSLHSNPLDREPHYQGDILRVVNIMTLDNVSVKPLPRREEDHQRHADNMFSLKDAARQAFQDRMRVAKERLDENVSFLQRRIVGLQHEYEDFQAKLKADLEACLRQQNRRELPGHLDNMQTTPKSRKQMRHVREECRLGSCAVMNGDKSSSLPHASKDQKVNERVAKFPKDPILEDLVMEELASQSLFCLNPDIETLKKEAGLCEEGTSRLKDALTVVDNNITQLQEVKKRLESQQWVNGNGYYPHDMSWYYGHRRSWWDGPNVCHSEDTDNSTADSTITHHYKTAYQVCEESESAYRCTTTISSSEGKITKTETFECCRGYGRQEDDFGCPQRLRLVNLPATAQNLGLNDLLRAVSSAGLEEPLTDSTFTVFAPQDGAFSDVTATRLERNRAMMVSGAIPETMSAGELQSVLLGHVLPESRRASSFRDEDVLQTGSPYDSTIRINFYSRPEKLTTANCVRVTSTDNLATNGVIHVVDKVLPTVTSSLMEMIQRDPQFSFLNTAVTRADLVSALQGEGQLTLFAPTNDAFRKLNQNTLNRLLSGDPKCLANVLKQHVLPNTICSAVIRGRVKSRNLLDNYLNLTRNDDGKVFVDDAQVVRADVMATNGVMHVIDDVLVPDDALDIVDVAEKNGLTELVGLVQAARLTSTLQNAANVTVFAPNNDAIQALPASTVRQLTSDPNLLRSVLTYHVVPEEVTCRSLQNNQLLNTLNPGAQIRINEYSNFPYGNGHALTAQCAPIVLANVGACNGIAHVIDKVMLPPRGTVVDVLAADPDYSTLVRLVKIAGLADALQADGPLTVFAPNNQAINQLDRETLRLLQRDTDLLTSILKLHVYADNLCCAGIFRNPWWRHQRITPLSANETLFLSRDRNGDPFVNDVLITDCDKTATNGVVHGIDRVLLPRPDPCQEQDQKLCELAATFGKDLVLEDLVMEELANQSDLFCLVCPNKRATNICLDCGDMYCAACASGHKKMTVTRHHIQQDLPQAIRNAPSAARASSEPRYDDDIISSTSPLDSIRHGHDASSRENPDIEALKKEAGLCVEGISGLKDALTVVDNNITQLQEVKKRLEGQQWLLRIYSTRLARPDDVLLVNTQAMLPRLRRVREDCCPPENATLAKLIQSVNKLMQPAARATNVESGTHL
nr:hypothetical protein BaRGS_030779 [Batillaria attramentaria]